MPKAVELIKTVFDTVIGGKKALDQVMNDPKVQREMYLVEASYTNELKHGNGYTKAARPTAMYLVILIVANDMLFRPYVNLWVAEDIPVLLTEGKFKLLIGFLTALGLARSVFDKQGEWIREALETIIKKPLKSDET